MEAISKKTSFWIRKLGHYEINWRIENICFALRSGNVTIQTPLFYLTGRMLTRWRLYLHTFQSDKESYLKLRIRRANTEFGPKTVWTQWKLFVKFVTNNEEQEISLGEFQRFFGKGDEYHCDKIRMRNLLDNFKPFETDVFKIRCIVLFNDQYSEHCEAAEAVDVGLVSLSNVLRNVLCSGKDCDLVLKNSGGDIKVHRSVLYYRNEVFAEMIENRRTDNRIVFDNVSRDDLFSVICYLYTGNFEEFVHKPTFAKQELAQLLDIEEVNNWFVLDKLHLESKYHVLENSHEWKFRSFSRESSYLGPLIKYKTFFFRLVFVPEGGDNLRLFLDDLNNNIPVNSYFQISLMKGRDGYKSTKEWIGRPYVKTFHFRSYGFESYAIKDLVDGTLRIRFKMKVCWNSNWSTSVNFINNQFPRTIVDHYKKLSMDMARVLKEGKFADVVIEYGTASFSVHKCILSGRSSVLARQLKKNKLMIRNFEPDVFQILLRYFYTGYLKGYKSCDIFTIYCLANKYAMASLLSLCSDLLRRAITKQTVADVLKISDEYEDESLKNSALEFVFRNADKVYRETTWKSFQKSNKSLNREVKEFLEAKTRDKLEEIRF